MNIKLFVRHFDMCPYIEYVGLSECGSLIHCGVKEG